MNAVTILVVLLLAAWAVSAIVQTKKRPCGGCCAGCPHADTCAEKGGKKKG